MFLRVPKRRAGAGVGVGMLGVEGAPLVENVFFLVSRLLGFFVSSFFVLWFRVFEFSTCPRFINSKNIYRFFFKDDDPILPKVHSIFLDR